jgi:ankyrin repeat protein
MYLFKRRFGVVRLSTSRILIFSQLLRFIAFIVDALLRIGADVDAIDYDRNTALHLACVLVRFLNLCFLFHCFVKWMWQLILSNL